MDINSHWRTKLRRDLPLRFFVVLVAGTPCGTCCFAPNICSSLPLMAGVQGGLRRIGKSQLDGGAGRVRSRCSPQGTSKAKRPTRETRPQKAMS